MSDISALGKNLRETRMKMGLTLDAVSGMTGVSKTMLSQIERSESVPTLSVVWKIVNGLKIRFETLMRDDNDQCVVNHVADVEPLISDKNDVFIYNVLPFAPENGFEVFYGEFLPGCDYPSGPHMNSEFEYCFVISGELEILVENKSYVLREKEFITFCSKNEHRYLNRGTETARAQFILSY